MNLEPHLDLSAMTGIELELKAKELEAAIDEASAASVDPMTLLAGARLLISLYRELRRRGR